MPMTEATAIGSEWLRAAVLERPRHPTGHDAAATLGRVAKALLIVVKYGVADLVSGTVARRRWARRLPSAARLAHTTRPERLRDMLQELGGAFLKFGQMLALQPDILPVHYCNALFDLLDRVPPFPFSEVDRICLEDLGKPAAALFDSIDPVPVASASIGQVHAAVLDGRKMAVKVQRPTARAQFTNDVGLMTLAMGVIRRLRLRRLYWLIEPLAEFVRWTAEELDYRCEARYMARLRQNAERNPHERVPEVSWAHVTPRILVSEFLEGHTVLAYLRARALAGAEPDTPPLRDSCDPHALVAHIIDNFLGDVLQHGMFHADLHPANLMILPGNVVGYIDFGITGTISRYSRQNIIALTLAYTRGDLAGMCAAFFRVSTIDEHSMIERFRAGLETASLTWYTEGVGGRRLRKNFTLVMLDMLRLSRATGIWPERDVIKYIRSAIAIDGLVTRVAPTFDVRRHLEAVCARQMAAELSRSAAVYAAIAGCARCGLRVLRTGGSRGAAILGRLARGDLPVRLELEAPPRRAKRPWPVVAAACVATVAVSASGQEQTTPAAVMQLSSVACIVALLARRRRGASGNGT